MAKRRKIRKTKNQLLYEKQVKRIKNAIRREEKKGFNIPSGILPEKPKRVTKKALDEIKSITPERIRNKSEYLDKTTGELLPYKTRKKEVKELQKTKKVDYVPTISYIEIVTEMLYGLERKVYPQNDISARKSILIRIFEDTITLHSDDTSYLERHLSSNLEKIREQIENISYNSKQETIEGSFIGLATILNVGPLSFEKASEVSEFSDSFGFYEDLDSF